MLVHNFEQNSPEWEQARLGVVTASTFGKIITAKTMKISASADEVENKAVFEILTGKESNEFVGNKHTERGHELEPDAVSMYEMIKGGDIQEVGFVTNDEGTIGCSPDRLIGEDGGLEIKCPLGHTHIKSFMAGTIADDHKPQVQGSLLITGRKWWDVMSYHPELTPSIIRVERDKEYIEKLEAALKTMLENIQTKINKLNLEE